MNEAFFEDKKYKEENFSLHRIPKGTYDACTFQNCNFGDTDLSGLNFNECEFIDCDFSMAKLGGTTLNDVQFKNCKLLGLHFDHCNDILFSMRFEYCNLNLSLFYKRNLKNTKFNNCQLHEVDFTETDLSGSSFINCDFSGAVFDQANLEKTDFRSSFNYIIDPEKNRIRKAKFSLNNITGLLQNYDIEIE
jgi:uncharacterized protein YjbI with pentapeptide repeats